MEWKSSLVQAATYQQEAAILEVALHGGAVYRYFGVNQRQTAPYVALCGCALTIVFEESRYCGHSGRVCYVFWRQRIPWVLVRLRNGETLSLPWKWTNLPQSLNSPECEADEPTRPVPILSAGALHDLVRFLHRRRNGPGGEL